MTGKQLKNYTGNKFYNGRKLWDTGAPWLTVLSERSDGKSLWMLKECIIEYFKYGRKIGYVRRFDTDIKQKDVNGYFRDKNFIAWLQPAGYSGVMCWQGELWLTALNEETGKNERVELIGYTFAINTQEHYKSQHFDCYNFLFEEFITKKLYLPNEYVEFCHTISTANRSGQFRAILIGNTLSRSCPYLREMGIDIYKAKMGKIYVQDLTQEDGAVIKSAFEYVDPREKQTVFIGSARKSIVDGAFEADPQPHLYFNFNDCETLYQCVYVMDLHQAFHVKYIIYEHPETKRIEKYVYIYPMDYDDVPYTHDDIFCNIPDYEHGYFYYAEKRRQRHIFAMLRAERALFSDNLTGTEFKQSLKKHNPFQIMASTRRAI